MDGRLGEIVLIFIIIIVTYQRKKGVRLFGHDPTQTL